MANQFGENYKFDNDIATKNGVSINVNDLIKYYITENHSKIETIEHFNVSGSFISAIIRHYNIKKSRQLSHEHNKKTCLKKYGNENYNNIEQNKKTCLEKYGVENVYQSDSVKEKCANTKLERYGDSGFVNREKQQQTCLDKYGSISPFGSKEVYEKSRKTCLEHFGVEYPMQSDEVKKKYNFIDINEKSFKTKKANGTTNTSKIQTWFIEQLRNIYGQHDVISEYKEERYPYHCDVYVKSLDQFIELNIYFTHGGHPFDSTSEEDIQTLNTWKEKSITSKFFQNAISVWTKTDVEKQRCANKNNLNYLMFYTEKEAINYINELGGKIDD